MMPRRAVLGSAVGAGAALLASGMPAAAAPRSIALLAGTYRRLEGKGVYPVLYDPHAEAFSVGAPLEALADASFGVRARSGAHYFVREQAEGEVSTWHGGRRSKPVASGGADPCHLALDATGRSLAVANYSSGNIALYRLSADGALPDAPTAMRQNAGRSANRQRQNGPHAHWVGFSPDQRWLHSVDLGTDQILSYPFDARGRTIGAALSGYRAPAGFGPRHMVFHPRLPLAYLVGELTNRVATLDVQEGGRFAERETQSTLPAGHQGASAAGHIAINAAGTTLYVSNRGSDSLAVFAIDGAGKLTAIQHIATGGAWPRFFLLIESVDRLICANERPGSLVGFAVAADGRLTPTGATANVPGVAFLGLD